MICQFRFDYNGPKCTKENLELLQSLVREKVRDWNEEKQDMHIYGNYTGDITAVMAAFPGKEIVIITPDLAPTVWEEVLQRLRRIEEKAGRVGSADQGFNGRCSVHVPGLGLLLINETKVMYDICTTALQDELDAGWRILAVCPQPDQRRPDYILGRTKPT